MSSWLEHLARHAIFSLPLDAPASSSQGRADPLHATTTTQQTGRGQPLLLDTIRPSTPKLPAIFPVLTPKPSAFSIPNTTTLSRTTTPKRSTNSKARSASPYEDETLQRAGKRNQRTAVIRGGTELVVAVGKQLRICDLKQAKAKAGEDPQGDLGEYKVLHAPEINFEVHQLVVNQNSKLLAVIGVHSIRVVELPRKGWTASTSPTIDVRCLEIGKFYHSLPGSSAIAQVLWHPLGQHFSSLLVLTADAQLREYTLHESTSEPSQTVSFVESTTSASRGFFSAEDEAGREATAMCLGDAFDRSEEGPGADWGKMTVYGLMKNGDLKSICPFLPKRSSISKSYLHGLASFVSTKLDYLSSDSSTSTAGALVPASKSLLSQSSDRSKILPPPPASLDLEKRYTLQLQYLQALLRQVPAPQDASNSGQQQYEDEDVAQVVAPVSRPNLRPKLQGPFLLAPATVELDNGAQDTIATDVVYVSYSGSTERERGRGKCLGVVAVVYADGKLEVGLEVEKVEARFEGETTTASREGEEDDLPVLLVFETLDLGYGSEFSNDRQVEQALDRGRNWPVLKRDELYGNDTIWIYSSLGVQCLVLGKGIDTQWQAALDRQQPQDTGAAGEDSQVFWVVKTHTVDRQGSRSGRGNANNEDEEAVNPPIVGFDMINDVYLGYSVIASTPQLQLVGVELSLRVDQDLLPSTESPLPPSTTATTNESGSKPPAYVSLLDSQFVVPTALTKSRTRPLPLSDSNSTTKTKEVTITPDSLRQFGKQVESYQTCIRELVQGADQVQHRLELQMKELSRQLSKLQELRNLTGDLRASTTDSSRPDGLVQRMKLVEENQVRLLDRLDRVLQRLMERHQGEDKLSTYEKKWFDELGRLEKEVKGGLDAKAKRVEAMWDELRPGVDEIVARRKQQNSLDQHHQQPYSSSPARTGLGKAQIQGLEAKLAEEAKLLTDAKKKVERLTQSLAATTI
ncbi:uncharacterized protein JCM15063_005516 [Sporobolomyces koalae]|uniref:uncharacterized protein n=1 Tax=Sporobolomyces koalae TaxID=500713 RepID=UPI0031827CA2